MAANGGHVRTDVYEAIVTIGAGPEPAVCGIVRQSMPGLGVAWQRFVRTVSSALDCTLAVDSWQGEESARDGIYAYRIVCKDWAQAKLFAKLLHKTAQEAREHPELSALLKEHYGQH